MPQKTLAFAAQTGTTPLALSSIDRRDPGPRDVVVDILYCGVCHSDLHTARGEWPGITFPVVPGHEMVGRVVKVGNQVTRHKVGDLGAIGCMVNSCRACANCREGLEQYCDGGGPVWSYNSPDPHLPGKMTYGGYSKSIVVDEHFVLRVDPALDLAATAPLLCAGITTYSPLRHWGATKGKKVGIVGLGGLGHMGVKFARAFGCHTVLFTTSPSKVEDGERLGADEVVISKDEAQMTKHATSFDFILDTVSASHNLDAYTSLLRRDGTLCLVGAPEHPHPSPTIWHLLLKRRSVAGSGIGGIPETQEMLDFCAKHKIVSDIEIIPIQDINRAYERMLKSDVKYRFVIDMASLK
ncbi:MAG: NAD(P)-dependent alcohol dehydrogenase [Planctomycetota bacterium]|nr:NAD(P)-dependent alcohol dehydrogenase [Planctomycetota bacterium]